jgi:predicted membrane channel-forming protein YqfA (hemolysin III family)
MNQYFPKWKKAYSWFALVGLLAIAYTSITGHDLKRLAVPIFHGVAGLIIFLVPFLVKDKAPKGFWWVGIGGALIGIGGIALAFLTSGKQLLFFSQEVVLMILAPLLLLMALAFAAGFVKQFAAE